MSIPSIEVEVTTVEVEVDLPIAALDVEVVAPEVDVEVSQPVIDVTAPTIDVGVDITTVEIDATSSPIISVDVEMSGPPGPPGAPGQPGPPGNDGPPGIGALSRYTHTQAMLSPTWIVEHNLGCHPTFVAEDAVGNVINGSPTYIDDNTLVIGFAYSITGRAACL